MQKRWIENYMRPNQHVTLLSKQLAWARCMCQLYRLILFLVTMRVRCDGGGAGIELKYSENCGFVNILNGIGYFGAMKIWIIIWHSLEKLRLVEVTGRELHFINNLLAKIRRAPTRVRPCRWPSRTVTVAYNKRQPISSLSVQVRRTYKNESLTKPCWQKSIVLYRVIRVAERREKNSRIIFFVSLYVTIRSVSFSVVCLHCFPSYRFQFFVHVTRIKFRYDNSSSAVCEKWATSKRKKVITVVPSYERSSQRQWMYIIYILLLRPLLPANGFNV